jgi:hypothetical protein
MVTRWRSAQAVSEDAPPRTSRWAALAVLCAGALMIVIDQTIVSVALPFIKADLGFFDSGLT